jgi:hypothetical protein
MDQELNTRLAQLGFIVKTWKTEHDRDEYITHVSQNGEVWIEQEPEHGAWWLCYLGGEGDPVTFKAGTRKDELLAAVVELNDELDSSDIE